MSDEAKVEAEMNIATGEFNLWFAEKYRNQEDNSMSTGILKEILWDCWVEAWVGGAKRGCVRSMQEFQRGIPELVEQWSAAGKGKS